MSMRIETRLDPCQKMWMLINLRRASQWTFKTHFRNIAQTQEKSNQSERILEKSVKLQ